MPSLSFCSRALSCAVFALVALGTQARAADPLTVGLDVGPSPGAVNAPLLKVDDSVASEIDLLVSYSLSGGVYHSLVLDLHLPPFVTVALSSHEATFTFDSCPYDSGTSGPRTCRWTATNLQVDNTGVAGSITVKATLDRYRWTHNQPVAMSVGASGSFTPSGGTQAAFTTARSEYDGIAQGFQEAFVQTNYGLTSVGWVEVETAPAVFESRFKLNYGYRFAGGGRTSTVFDHTYATINVGPAFEVDLAGITTEPSWEFVAELPSGDDTTELLFRYRTTAPVETLYDIHHDSDTFYVPLSFDCDALADQQAGDFVVASRLDWDERMWPPPYTFVPHVFTHQIEPIPQGACGTGATTTKSNYQWWPAHEDGYGLSSINVSPPVGVTSATDVFIVDDLPDGLTTQGFHARPPAQFQVYRCNFTGQPAGDVSIQYFEDHIGQCTLLPGDNDPSFPMTHLVAYAPIWGGSVPLRAFGVAYETYVPPGYFAAGHPAAAYNRVYVHGTALLDGAPYSMEVDPELSFEADPWKAEHILNIIDEGGACPAVGFGPIGATTASPRAVAPGNQLRAELSMTGYGGTSRPLNPTITLDPSSPRVRIIDVAIYPTGHTQCSELTLVGTPGPLGTTGTYTANFEGRGSLASCFTFIIEMELDPDGWTNNEVFTLDARMTADNTLTSNPGCDGRRSITYSVAVGAELRGDVMPSCIGNGGDPAFDITARNNGGIDFPSASMRFPIPANTTLRSVTADPGVTVLCVLPGEDPTACTDPAAVAVIGSGFALLAPSGAKTMHVNLATNLGFGAVVTGNAIVRAGDLNADSGQSVPFAVDDCRYEIAVTKVFDDDNNGTDVGDAPLANWAFTIDPPGGSTTTTVTTDVDGVARFFVRAGSYTITEVLPAQADGVVWHAFGGALSQQVVVVEDPGAPVPVAFANYCSCAQLACSAAVGACTINGCDYRDEPDCEDAPVYHVSVRTAAGPAVVACRLDKSQIPPVLDCAPPNTTLPSACGGPQE